jgi:hypothetical protein
MIFLEVASSNTPLIPSNEDILYQMHKGVYKTLKTIHLDEIYSITFRGCMYEKQTQSKKSRHLDKTLGLYFQVDKLFEQLYKKHYAGKPTKKYLKLTQQIQKVESITRQEIEKAIL